MASGGDTMESSNDIVMESSSDTVRINQTEPSSCSAYSSLKNQIGHQCTSYRKLHKNGVLGKVKGMYDETNDDRESIPAKDGAATFLRGGIITSMACFEAFLHDLLLEVLKNLSATSEELTKVDKKEFNNSALHGWSGIYTEFLKKYMLQGSTCTFTEALNATLKECPMNYYYLLDKNWVSRIRIKNANVICFFLRLFYGLRCIMAHGNSKITLKEKVLKQFPECASSEREYKCESDPENLGGINALSKLYNKIEKSEVLKLEARKFPRRQPIVQLSDDDSSKNGISLIDKYFKDVEVICEKTPQDIKEADVANWNCGLSDGILDENYAFFHILRIHRWLEKNTEEAAYVTYNMLVRVNQFILLMAHRMMFTVAKIIMDNDTTLTAVWGVPKDEKERKKKIDDFEKEHKGEVKKFQKPPDPE